MNKELKQHETMKDRGAINWTSLMLPEHIAQLRDWQAEDDKVEHPELNEWDLASLQEELDFAHRRKCQALIKTWRDGQIILHQGTIEIIDIHNQTLILADPFGDIRIGLNDIISVQSVD
ncbi:hypothetical protein HNO89_003295 [Sporosarcina luteola]|nr:hypothetical protein [Sporosarcina luteola]